MKSYFIPEKKPDRFFVPLEYGVRNFVRTVCILTSAICVLTSYTASAQAGSLDLTFDTDGMVTTDFGTSTTDNGYSVAIQSDGKIVVAGTSTNGPNDDFGVVRYNSNGSLDNSFGTGGIVSTPIGSVSDAALSVAIQSDGKIVVAGYSNNGANFDIAVVRYNTNGTLDNTFDTDGILTTPVGTADDRGYSVAIQTDGKIVVAGHTHNGANYDIAVVRYNTNGTLDNTFDTDGMLTTPIGTNENAYSVTIQSDGKIVVTGNSFSASWDFFIVRYNTNGALDNMFDSDGIVLTDFGTSTYDIANSVAIQSDGKIVVAGYSYNGLDYDFALARYNTNGTLDNTFDTDGKVITAIGPANDDGFEVAIQADGKIVVAGSSNNGVNDDFALVRYNTNGSLDITFDTDGIVTTDIGGFLDAGYATAIQTDGKIVVAGFSFGSSSNDFAVTRYNGDIGAAILENTEQVNLNIYPNPSTGKFFIAGEPNQSIGIEIYNALGEKIYQSTIPQLTNSAIDISSQPDGLYFYQVINAEKVVGTGKIIVQK